LIGRAGKREWGITYLFRTKVIEWGEEDGQSGVDADDPGEGEDVVNEGQKDWYSDEETERARDRFEEGAALPSRPPLLGADKPCPM